MSLALLVPAAQEDARGYFDSHPDFEIQDFVGNGASGIGVLVRERRPHDQHPPQRFVVKRAIYPEAEPELRQEALFLETLRGAPHIVQLFSYYDPQAPRPSVAVRAVRAVVSLIRPGPGVRHPIGPGLEGPSVVLEYVENGTMLQLFERSFEHEITIPNRILWSFFLCLIRSCIALANPPYGRYGRLQLETIPPGAPIRGALTHGDLAMRNIMVGDDLGFPEEHRTATVGLKLIDLGMTSWGDDKSIEQNILEIAKAIAELMIKAEVTVYRGAPSQMCFPDPARPDEGIRTFAVQLMDNPELDDDLRMLLARCLAVDPNDRPSLADLLDRAQRAVNEMTEEAYEGRPQAGNETDAVIHGLIQLLVFDANAETVQNSDLQRRRPGSFADAADVAVPVLGFAGFYDYAAAMGLYEVP